MDTRKKVRAQIDESIRDWGTSDEKPPFTMEELVAMALIHVDEPLRFAQIGKWVASSFQYYPAPVSTSRASQNPYFHRNKDYFIALQTTLRRFKVPLILYGPRGNITFDISFSNALAILERPFGRYHRQGSFPFFRLPPELRHDILELAFCSSGSPMLISLSEVTHRVPHHTFRQELRKGFERRVYTAPTLYDEHDDANATIAGCNLTFYKHSEALSALLVSRQFHADFMRVFYSSNQFAFWNVQELHTFLTRTAEDRLKRISSLAFNCNRDTTVTYIQVIGLLARLPRLRKLDITIEERSWPEQSAEDTGKPSMHAVVVMLRHLRGMSQVTFHGNHEKVKILVEKVKAVMLRATED